MALLTALAGKELHRMRENWKQDLERFAHRARRAGQVHDERRADGAGDPAREHAVGGLLERSRVIRSAS